MNLSSSVSSDLFPVPEGNVGHANDLPATCCRLIGCFLSHNWCLPSSPITAGFGSVAKTTHSASEASHSRSLSDRLGEEVLLMGSAAVFHLMWVFWLLTRPTSTLLLPLVEKQQTARMKPVFVFVRLWVAVRLPLQPADLAAVASVAPAVIWLAPNQNTPTVFFLFKLRWFYI